MAVSLKTYIIHFTNHSVNPVEEIACTVSENKIKIRKYVNMWCVL